MHHLVFNQRISMWHKVVLWDFRREREGYWPEGQILLSLGWLSCQARWNFSSGVKERSGNEGTPGARVRAALCQR